MTQKKLKEFEIMRQNAIYLYFVILLISGEKMLMSAKLMGGVT